MTELVTDTSSAPTASDAEEATTPRIISDEDRAAAEESKVQGNDHFTASRYPQAAESYSLAIEKNPESAVYYSNRAATFLKMEQFGLG